MPPAASTLGLPSASSELSPFGQLRDPAVSCPPCQARPCSQTFLGSLRPLGRGHEHRRPRLRSHALPTPQCQHVHKTETLSLKGPTWEGVRQCPNGLQVGAQQEAEAFCIHILPTGSMHGWAAGLGAETCVSKRAPRFLHSVLPQAKPLWPLLLPL